MFPRPQKNPATPDEWNCLGRYFYQNRVFNLAVEAFQEAVRARPHHLTFRKNLGIALLDLGEYRQAVEHLSQVLAEAPDSPKVNYYLGMAHAKLKDFDRARKFYTKVLELKVDPHWEELAREKLDLLEIGMADLLEYTDFVFRRIANKEK
jgi:Flp pilus assembly protein TadD